MIATPAQLTSAFDRSVGLLVSLHELFKRGMQESPEADAIRDEMDRPWYAMKPEEQEMIRELSADLYTISDPPREAEVPLSPEFKAQINDALCKQNYAVALRLLRENKSQIDLSSEAFLHGICWSGLGIPAAAAEFFLHAANISPQMEEARLCALSTLISGGREQDALQFATPWAVQSENAALWLKAAEVLFLNAVRLPIEEARDLHLQNIAIAKKVIEGVLARDNESKKQIVLALLQMAVSHARLGDSAKARELCVQARKEGPDSVIAMMVDGLLNDLAPPASDEARVTVARQIAGFPATGDTLGDVHSHALQSSVIKQFCSAN